MGVKMTKKQKANKAIKEANKMADLELLKSKIDGYKKTAKDWLDVEVHGYKRSKIILAFAVIVIVVLSV
jgi:hypothetical protein